MRAMDGGVENDSEGWGSGEWERLIREMETTVKRDQ